MRSSKPGASVVLEFPQDEPTPKGSKYIWSREIDTCPATRHSHGRKGYLEYGCRCPSTIKAYEAAKEKGRAAQRRYARGESDPGYRQTRRAQREIANCPAQRHRHSHYGYLHDGCRCPSTIASQERWKEAHRQFQQRKVLALRDHSRISKVDLRRADWRDAEALAIGPRLGKVSKHTRAMAVRLMLERDPELMDREIAERLNLGGQGPIAIRSVSRIVAAIQLRRQLTGRPLVKRFGLHRHLSLRRCTGR